MNTRGGGGVLRTKIPVLMALAFLLSSSAAAQGFSQMVERRCGAPLVTSGAEFERLQRVTGELLNADRRSEIRVVLIDSMAINAWAVQLKPRQSLICISSALVRWQREADGELAFIVGHELGHANNEACQTARGRARLARRSHSLGRLLFGASEGDEAGDLRRCETLADEFGLRALVSAGYASDDAIAAFQRLRTLQHDQREGIIGRMAAIGSDHPITSDRIKHLRRLINRRR